MEKTKTGMPAKNLFIGESGRRLWGRVGLVVLWLSGIALVVGALGLAGLAALIAHGPVEVETATRAIQAILGDIAGADGKARLGSTRIDWSWEEGIGVEVTDIALDRGAGLSLSVPRAEIRLRMLPILTGTVRPRSLVFFDPRIAVDLSALASPSPTPAAATPAPTPPAGAPAPDASLPECLRGADILGRVIDHAVVNLREQGLESVGVRNGAVEIRRKDPTGSIRHVFVEAIDADGVVDGPSGELDAGVSARSEVGRWSMRLTQTRGADGKGRSLTFSASDITRHDFFGPGGPAFELGMPFYPEVKFEWDAAGRLSGAGLDMRIGAGDFRFGPEPSDHWLVDEGRVRGAWRPQDRAFEVSTLMLTVGETGMTLGGTVKPPADGSGLWAIDLTAEQGGFRPRDVPGERLPLDGGALHGTFDEATRFFDVQDGHAEFGGASVRTAGRIDLSGPDPKLRLDLQFSPLSSSQIAHVWPHWVAPEARDWFIQNVETGHFSDLTMRLDIPRMDKPQIWGPDAFQASARFDGLRFKPFGNLPSVAGGDGRLSIFEKHFDVVFDHAQAATRWAKHPTVDGLRFTVADMFVKPPRGSVRFQIVGETPALAEIVDSEPLAVLEQSGIRKDGLGGVGTVAVQIDILFEPTITMASVDYKIDATLDKFTNTNPIQGRKFQDGKFHVLSDPKGVKVTGRALTDGVFTDIDMFVPVGGSKLPEKHDFKMVLDDAARSRVGIDLGGLVLGAIGLSVTQPGASDPRRHIEADLSAARLVLPYFGWTKGAGVPAKAVFDWVDDDKGGRIDNLSIDSEGLTVRGAAVLDKDRHILSADIAKFALRKGDDAKIKVSRANDGTTAIAFDASSFDVRGLIQSSRRAGDDGEKTKDKASSFTLKLRAARLLGFNETTFSDVSVDLAYRGDAFQTLAASARTSGGRSVSAVIKPEADHRRFTLTSEDAGAMLRFLDAFDRIQSGRLTLSSRLDAAGTAEGMARLQDFRLLEEPPGGRVAASRQGADGTKQIQVRRAEIDKSTDFDRASVRFKQADGVIWVIEGIAKGASVGATAAGQIDLGNQRMSLSGTYIPAYGLNNLAGRIPILGAITGAGSDGGLVGVTFRVVGAIDDPILQINPLSAVAPGIFRRIFEFQPDDAPAAKPDSNAPTKITP